MARKPMKVSEEQREVVVTLGMCAENQNGCKADWDRYLTLVYSVVGGFVVLIFAIAVYLNGADREHGQAIASVQTQVAVQQTDLSYVKKGVDEIRQNQLTLIEELQKDNRHR